MTIHETAQGDEQEAHKIIKRILVVAEILARVYDFDMSPSIATEDFEQKTRFPRFVVSSPETKRDQEGARAKPCHPTKS
ncbi:MAG: hypothetical protein SF123_04185 [Chloroflexota bacterium]|nr:hypothetical protein [Chloroflexota bacterium]